MTHNPSRKKFFANLFGAAAVLSVFPKLFARSTSPQAVTEPAPQKLPFQVRADRRAVARRAESL